MARTDPGGQRPVTHPAPDTKPFDESNYVWDWPQSDRERGAVRHPEGARSFETAWAVVDTNGRPIGSVLAPGFADLADQLRRLRLSLVLQGTAFDLGDLEDLKL